MITLSTFLIISFFNTSTTTLSEKPLGDIVVGDCIALDQIQSLTGVSDPSLYIAGKCGVSYESAGTLTDELSCGLELPGGAWSRTTKQHKEPGFFWPKPTPCMTSVTSLEKEVYKQELISDDSMCSADEVYVSSYQTENLKTERFKIGQGEAYLPYPLTTHKETFVYSNGKLESTSCTDKTLFIKYMPLTKVHVKLDVYDCKENQRTSCQMMEIIQGKDSEGNSCGSVERIWDCE
jgi:hypothetical protein